jgi:hypothetical protein
MICLAKRASSKKIDLPVQTPLYEGVNLRRRSSTQSSSIFPETHSQVNSRPSEGKSLWRVRINPLLTLGVIILLVKPNILR